MKLINKVAAMAILISCITAVSACKKKSDDTPAAGPVPVLITSGFSNILLTTAKCTGNITSDGGTFVAKRGFCWSHTNQNPSIQDDTVIAGNGAGIFSATLNNLKGQSVFYVRAFATNSSGTGYGSILTLTTLDSTISDIDNNHYRIVQIGTQVWMAENLKTTKYRNGNTLPNVYDATEWSQRTAGAYCEYDNSSANANVYGILYNWYAVSDSRNIAPVGWHVPSHDEFTVLLTYLGGKDVAGGKLKEAGTTHWDSPNTGATNETGFTALAGGYRSETGLFGGKGGGTTCWLSTDYGNSNAWFMQLTYNNPMFLNSVLYIKAGASLRCVRD